MLNVVRVTVLLSKNSLLVSKSPSSTTKKRIRSPHPDNSSPKSKRKLDQQRPPSKNIQKPPQHNLAQYKNQSLNRTHKTNHNLVPETPSWQRVRIDPEKSTRLVEEEDCGGRSRRKQTRSNIVYLNDEVEKNIKFVLVF